MTKPSPVREQLQNIIDGAEYENMVSGQYAPFVAFANWLIDGIEEALADLRQIDYRTRYLDNAQRVLERLLKGRHE